MKVPISWLKDYVDITLPIPELAGRLLRAGVDEITIETIGVEGAKLPWDRERIRVGQIVRTEPHPNADRLKLLQVDVGSGQVIQMVTGAPNIDIGDHGQKVAIGLAGAQLYDGHAEGQELMILKGAKIRGVYSDSMVLSEKELGLSEDHEGIIILPDEAPLGMPLADYLGDVVMDVQSKSNLARTNSMIGLAREVAALTGQKLRYPDTDVRAEGEPARDDVRIEIENPHLCSRYTAAIIRHVAIGPSPDWMARRLTLAGMRPISVVVDITNYVMLEWGQPLHAFDYDKLVARAGGGIPTITVRTARPGEQLTTLDGAMRELAGDDLLICDSAGPIALAGVMGGADTEVGDETRNILLESANFDYISIRRTAARHRLPSEAATRFGRGVHPALTVPAARRASELMRTLAAGTVAKDLVDEYPEPLRPVTVDLTLADIQRIAGVDLAIEEVRRILQSLEFVVEEIGPDKLRVTSPLHRLDIEGPHDLIEEVVRIYGLDNIPSIPLSDTLPPQRTNRSLELEEQTRDLMVKAGLQEIITYAMTTPQREALLTPPGATGVLPDVPYLTIANPISSERTVMRHTLMPQALDTVAANLRFRDRVAVFEVGFVYLPVPGQLLPDEPRRLAIAMTGPREPLYWEDSDRRPVDFFDLKGVVESLVDELHIPGVSYDSAQHPTFHPGRVATLVIGGQSVGVLGEIHPLVREAFDLPGQPVLLSEIDLDLLLSRVPEAYRIRDISRYPAVIEDLAVVVPESVPAEAVLKTLTAAGGELLRRVQLFDVYRGESIPAGHKSLAYRLTYQAADRTLADVDVTRVRQRIIRALEADLEATVRK